MKVETKTYMILAIVFCASLMLKIWTQPVSPWGSAFTEFLTFPIFLSIVGALFRLVLDNLNHERNLRLQRDQQVFHLAATSHMADVVFDKHVQFCEAYMAAVDEELALLWHSGNFEQSLDIANKLTLVRRQHATWIPQKLHKDLDHFESLLRQVGARLIAARSMNSANEEFQRKDWITNAFETLAEVMELTELDKNAKSAEQSSARLREKVKSLLRMDDLLALRDGIITRSLSTLQVRQKL